MYKEKAIAIAMAFLCLDVEDFNFLF